MSLGAVAHALAGWGDMRHRLHAAGADAELIGSLGAGWLYGSAMMAAAGAIVLLGARRLSRGDASGLAAVRVIAAAYVVYGAAALVLRHGAPHFYGFIALGLLAGVPAWRARPHS